MTQIRRHGRAEPVVHSVKLRIEICEITTQRYEDRLVMLDEDEAYINSLMSQLDEYDVSSDQYYQFMSQLIIVWAEMEDLKAKIKVSKEELAKLMLTELLGDV
ncbi:uncharacterized protein H6S33_011121 [Morchella sextelata]|jgi:hypothetical protein|uniref:uncharacterized protein n=1 Tax=Morchella sextelata TaxID=1174677 RepID=UPI001D055E6D|nr:uncharacterized protein H6S33_011121 [Morchella sextelata]KAH0611856.1 hypothetical protein H6S33_011121 [Morchella sextelata]